MHHRAVTATAVDHHPDDAGMQAYLDLLASSEPLTPPAGQLAHRARPASDAPPASADAERAYLELLASTAPLTPADLLPRTAANPRLATGHPAHRTPSRRSAGSRRANGHSGSHAAALIGNRTRHAVVVAAMAVSVGVAGLGAGVAATASPGRADSGPVGAPAQRKTASAATPAAAPDPTAELPGTAAQNVIEDALSLRGEVTPTEEYLGAAPQRSSTRALRKPKPLPKPVVVTATWVNPLPEASVTSCFGQRWGRLHAGVDLAAPHGTRIRAAGAGVVVAAGEAGGYGNAVLIDHGNGFLTHYGHMSTITAKVGQRVVAGQEIGHEGSTGHSTGPHLHFEVHEDHYKNPIEPTAWMRAHGVNIPGCNSDTAPADDH